MRQLNLDQLHTLVTAADLGSLAEAARALHLSAPAVSLHIQELESRLGVPLLERGRGRTKLTPAGEVLAEGGRQVLNASRKAMEAARRRGLGLAGRLRLATTAGVEPELLPQLLHTLERRVPGAEVQLDALGSRQSIERLRSGLVDLALVALPLQAGPEIELVPWRSDPVVLVHPRPWKVPRAVTAAWLSQQPWMSFGPGTQLHELVSAWFAKAKLAPQPRFCINQPDALLAMVRAGRGAALLPWTAPGSVAGVVTQPLSPKLMRQLAIAHRKQEGDPLVMAAVEAIAALAPARRKQ